MQTPGSQFLHQRNTHFHASPEVESVVNYLREGGEQIPNNPVDKISAHLGFLADREIVNDGILTGDPSSIERQIEANVIKDEEVPEAYFDLQRRIARERGYGNIELTPPLRKHLIEAIQADQRAGLGTWVEYLGGDDGGYPDWFKSYVWSSLTRLGAYDKDEGVFQKRSRGTTAPYPELNREALAYVYDRLNKHIRKEKIEDAGNDTKLRKLLQSGNFGKLYAHAFLEVTPDNSELHNEIRGSWKKYSQTDDPRTARRLSSSIQGHGTGWCTAGESTAQIQLKKGDFYTYYTRDEEGQDRIPRIAIRMENGKVAEVRGVKADQELEPAMIDIAAEQLKDLPGGDEYNRKVEDMKRLTAIEKKVTADPGVNLTKEELHFLYELDHTIQGFGYKIDPRIAEIRNVRGERDKPELVEFFADDIRKQSWDALRGYNLVAGSLHEAPAQPQEMTKLLAAKSNEWRANGIYDYLVEQHLNHGTRFKLVATPNITANVTDIVRLAERFGMGKDNYVRDHTFSQDRFSDEDWSGKTADGELFRLSLIPTQGDKELSQKPLATQLAILRERQTKYPQLNFRVPSLLEAVSYWHTLRVGGDTLSPRTTMISHFDLHTGTSRGGDIPESYVHNGAIMLSGTSELGGDQARLAVG